MEMARWMDREARPPHSGRWEIIPLDQDAVDVVVIAVVAAGARATLTELVANHRAHSSQLGSARMGINADSPISCQMKTRLYHQYRLVGDIPVHWVDLVVADPPSWDPSKTKWLN